MDSATKTLLPSDPRAAGASALVAASARRAGVGVSTVLFVGARDAGCSQLARAVFERAARGRHDALSAGAITSGRVDAAVLQVLSEIGIDISRRGPRLLTRELLDRADVVVRIGCGDSCPIIPGVRYLDWDLHDTAGRSIEELRALRDELVGIVDGLLGQLVFQRVRLITTPRARLAALDPLANLERQILEDLSAATSTLETTAAALADPSAPRTAAIARDARTLKARAARAHSELATLAARHTHAGDLRLVLALLELAQLSALIADQLDLISRQLKDLNPETIDRHNAGGTLARVAATVGEQLTKATRAFRAGDAALADELDHDDDQIDKLGHEITNAAAATPQTPPERELAIRHALIARALERIGNHAIDIAKHTASLLTAEPHQPPNPHTPLRR